MASEDGNTWSGGNRSSVLGNEKGAIFTVGMNDAPTRKVPERLLMYKKEPLTAEQISQRQQEAADRKKIHDDHRARQARKVREEVMRFDRAVQSRLGATIQTDSNQGQSREGQWYKNAIAGKKS